MARVQCYNCRKETPVVAPHYRCKFCNYPLNKYIQQDKEPEEEVIIDKPQLVTPDEEAQLNELFRQNVDQSLHDIKEVIEQLRPDEIVERSVTGPVILKHNLNPEKTGKLVAGWLVVHTEGKIPITYELFEGDNIIGRPDGPHQVDIRVEDDEYVSRVHSVIRIYKDFSFRFRYELVDDGSLRRGSPSTNGTYINGNEERLPKDKVVFLRDSDTIQVGTTKLVFKSVDAADDVHSAAFSVARTDFTNTVSIRL